jgi:adenylylsulfate kinase
MPEQKATNITWHIGEILKVDRDQFLGQRGVVIWFTGLSASGKSTLAHALEKRLFENGNLCYVLDGDNIRHGLNKNLGFSPEDREENVRRIGEVAKLFADAGVIVLTAFISPYGKDRQTARNLVQEGDFIEVYCKVPIEVAEDRDPKGLYKKAKAGEIKEFTGISAPYEEPENPEIVIDTSLLSLDESVDKVASFLVKSGVMSED